MGHHQVVTLDQGSYAVLRGNINGSGGIPWSLTYRGGFSLVLCFYNIRCYSTCCFVVVILLIKWEVSVDVTSVGAIHVCYCSV